MRKLLIKNKMDFVNLYFNDVVALRKVTHFCDKNVERIQISQSLEKNP